MVLVSLNHQCQPGRASLEPYLLQDLCQAGISADVFLSDCFCWGNREFATVATATLGGYLLLWQQCRQALLPNKQKIA